MPDENKKQGAGDRPKDNEEPGLLKKGLAGDEDPANPEDLDQAQPPDEGPVAPRKSYPPKPTELQWWTDRYSELRPIIGAIVLVFGVLSTLLAGFIYFAENEIREYVRKEIIHALTAGDTVFLENLDEEAIKSRNFLAASALSDEMVFRESVLRALSGKETDYLDGREDQFRTDENLLRLIEEPPAVRDLRRQIDAVYVLEFSREAIQRTSSDGTHLFDSDGNPVVDVIYDDIEWVHANTDQRVCVSMQWGSTTPSLRSLLKNKRARAYAEIGSEKVEIDYNGIRPFDVTHFIEEAVTRNQQRLFSIKVSIDDSQSRTSGGQLQLPNDYYYSLSAVVTVYKGKTHGICDA